jgi:hypothetical protein
MRGKIGVVAGGVVGAACTLILGITAAPAAFADPGGGTTTRVASNNASNATYPDAECYRLAEYYHSQGRGASCQWHPPITLGYSELIVGGTSW